MGIKGLMPLIQEFAPGAVRELQGPEAYTGASSRSTRACPCTSSSLRSEAMVGRAARPPSSPTVRRTDVPHPGHVQPHDQVARKRRQAGVRLRWKTPEAKDGELAKRQAKRKEAEEKLKKAQQEGNTEDIEKYSGMLTKVSRKDCEDVKALLRMMGVPVVEAPCEAEAQCGELVKGGKAHAVGTEDMDALTFGATRQLRNLTFTKKGKDSDKKILEITHSRVLEGLELTE